MSGYEERLALARAFYGGWSEEDRARFLARERVSVVVIPKGDVYEVRRLDSRGSTP
jgi:hypothetical protein